MTNRNESYYKEFQELLKKLKSKVSEIKSEKQNLLHENRALSKELREVRSQLTQSRKETDELKSQLKTDAGSASDSGFADYMHRKSGNDSGVTPVSDQQVPPTLFDNLTENEKIVMRQQITELIDRIDKHLTRSETS